MKTYAELTDADRKEAREFLQEVTECEVGIATILEEFKFSVGLYALAEMIGLGVAGSETDHNKSFEMINGIVALAYKRGLQDGRADVH